MKIFLDGADIKEMERYAETVDGFTTNPALMRKSNITHYPSFIDAVLKVTKGKPVSFEVLADEPGEIYRQAKILQAYDPSVWVKIPICTSAGIPLSFLIQELASEGVKLNVTAIFTIDQCRAAWSAISKGCSDESFISVFAGRLMDAGYDAREMIGAFLRDPSFVERPRILWASTREAFNVTDAENCGCDMITLSAAILDKRRAFWKRNLDNFTIETVAEFVAASKGIEL